jgi:hypothetical protein
MKIVCGAFIAALVAASVSAYGADSNTKIPHTIQDLYTECSSQDEDNQLLCLAYLATSRENVTFIGRALFTPLRNPTADRLRKILYCVPNEVTNGQLRQVFINWAEKNPKDWQTVAVAGVIVALREAWPCPD